MSQSIKQRADVHGRRNVYVSTHLSQVRLPWEHLPQELGWGSGTTAWRRLHLWQKLGIWRKIHEALLAHLQGAGQIDWSRAIDDSSSIRAVHGGRKRAPIQQIAANPVANITLSRTRPAFPSRPR